MPKFLDAPNWYDEGGNLLSPKTFSINGTQASSFGNTTPKFSNIWGPTTIGPGSNSESSLYLLGAGYDERPEYDNYQPPEWVASNRPLLYGYFTVNYSSSWFTFTFFYPCSRQIDADDLSTTGFSGISSYFMHLTGNTSAGLGGFGVELTGSSAPGETTRLSSFITSVTTAVYSGTTSFVCRSLTNKSTTTINVTDSSAIWYEFHIEMVGSFFGDNTGSWTK